LWCRKNNRRKTKSEFIRENIFREKNFFSAFQNHFIDFFFIIFFSYGRKKKLSFGVGDFATRYSTQNETGTVRGEFPL
jgi:hypothetical protein